MEKGGTGLTESDFDIDMILQNFAEDYDSGAQTANDNPCFRLSPIHPSFEAELGDSNAEEQIWLDSANVDLGTSFGISQNLVKDYDTRGVLF